MFVKPFFGKHSEPGKVDGARNRFPWEDTMMRHTRLWVIYGLALVSGTPHSEVVKAPLLSAEVQEGFATSRSMLPIDGVT